jgi:hypothetical protein
MSRWQDLGVGLGIAGVGLIIFVIEILIAIVILSAIFLGCYGVLHWAGLPLPPLHIWGWTI